MLVRVEPGSASAAPAQSCNAGSVANANSTPQRDRIAPTLGEPPPSPKLKPTPTPTPPPEIVEGDIVRINADLVQLHVRVIDRNNRPINNVPQNEFQVFEDGVPQPSNLHARGSADQLWPRGGYLRFAAYRSCKA